MLPETAVWENSISARRMPKTLNSLGESPLVCGDIRELANLAQAARPLVPTLCVGTSCHDAPRRPDGSYFSTMDCADAGPQSGYAVRSHAERGNEIERQKR